MAEVQAMDTTSLLQVWFSSAMPTGAFAWSHGLEQAIADEDVVDAASLGAWVIGVVSRGSGRNDALLMSAAFQAEQANDRVRVAEIDSLARALVAGRERLEEGLSQGRAFAQAAAPWVAVEDSSRQMLPITVGVLCARAGLPLEQSLIAAIQAFASNLVWIGARLVPVGQQQAMQVIASLMPVVAAAAHDTSSGRLDELGSATPRADIASMRHEHLHSRVCMS